MPDETVEFGQAAPTGTSDNDGSMTTPWTYRIATWPTEDDEMVFVLLEVEEDANGAVLAFNEVAVEHADTVEELRSKTEAEMRRRMAAFEHPVVTEEELQRVE